MVCRSNTKELANNQIVKLGKVYVSSKAGKLDKSFDAHRDEM
jgi:hypothetical protein